MLHEFVLSTKLLAKSFVTLFAFISFVYRCLMSIKKEKKLCRYKRKSSKLNLQIEKVDSRFVRNFLFKENNNKFKTNNHRFHGRDFLNDFLLCVTL